jgi:hypothetical protein
VAAGGFASTPPTIGIVVKTPTAKSAIKPIRNQQTNASAKRNPSSSD